MARQNNSALTKTVQILLCVCSILIGAASEGPVLAAELNHQGIKSTLVRIQEKYEALAAIQKNEADTNRTLASLSEGPEGFKQTVLPTDEQPNASISKPDANDYKGRFAVGEELIFEVTIGSIPLGDILAIKSALGVKIGLSEFFQLVDFPIDVDVDDISATGWFIAQKNVFSLSTQSENTLLVSLNNRQFTVTEERFIIDDDIYVELADIADWFSVISDIDEAQLVIDLITNTPFPIESKLKRQSRSLVNRGGFTESVLPLKESEYKLFSVPLLDVQVSTSFTESSNSSSYSIMSSQDVAYFSSQAFFYGNDEKSLLDARLTLSRQSKKSDLLGPLNMSEYAFGDVVPVNIGGGATQSLGRGFTMSNASGRLVDNRRVNLVGELQLGWDVELYRNGILIDNRTNVDSGRYEFNDTELNYGENNFELVFYGPQGQIERRTESHYVDSNALDGGQGIMQFSVVDNNRSLFGVGDSIEDPSQLGVSVASTYEYGLTDWLSFGVGASMFLPEQGENLQGVSIRSNLTLGSLGLLNSTFQFDDDNSRSMYHSFRTKVADIGWNISYQQRELFADASSNLSPVTSSTSDSLSVRMSGTLFENSSFPVNYENAWRKIESGNGSLTEQFQNSIGMNTIWGSFSHGLVWQRNDANNLNYNDTITDYESGGTLAYKKRFGPVFTRLFSNYQIKPVSELTSFGTILSYPFTNQINSEIRYTYNAINKSDRYDLRFNWRTDAFTFSSSASYDYNDNWNVNLGIRFGLGYDTATDTLFSSGRSLGDSGAVVLRMFEDENLDQKYTPGEKVLDNVSVNAIQSFRQEMTSEDGVAILKSLSTERATDIVVDEDSFSNPSMMLSKASFSVAARRGLFQQFDIPVVKGGELDGTIYIRDEAGIEDIAPYVSLSLVNNEGEVIASTRSAFDGYYLFEKILPGSYQIIVDTSKGSQRGTTPERLKEVKISNRGDLIVDVNMVLRQLQSANGYIANVGEFSSLGLLKVFFNLLNRRIDSNLLDGAFFIELEGSNRYLLGIKYLEGQNEASRESIVEFCQELLLLDVNCQADNVEFKY
jgi:hypothetical protein